MGFLKNRLSSEDTPQAHRPGALAGEAQQELLGLIEDYQQGLVPPIVRLTLLKHHLSRHQILDRLHQQVCLHPFPKELILRSHV